MASVPARIDMHGNLISNKSSPWRPTRRYEVAHGGKDPIRYPQFPRDPAVEVVHTAWGRARNRSVGSTSTLSKMWSVVGFYRDDAGLKEPILTSY